MTFETEIVLTGPLRSPAQMLQEQEVDGHSSIHDGDTAASLGLTGAPIEAPTHFSQFDPLAYALWGDRWFEHGCISCHFRTMVVEGEQVQATLTTTAPGAGSATIEAHKADGTPVLAGTASVGPEHGPSALSERLAGFGDPGDLFIVDRLHVGMRSDGAEIVSVDRDTPNGSGYPFSLNDKLARITETTPWYFDEGAAASPWGRAILPFEMISVMASKSGFGWPVRSPALGLFLDLEVRLLGTPLFVGEPYALTREVVGLGQSRRTESYWTRTTISPAAGGDPVAEVLLHSGVFKDSYPGYPKQQ